MKLDIEFYLKSTEKAFKEAKKELKEKSTFTEKEINAILKGLYYAVAEEYGD